MTKLAPQFRTGRARWAAFALGLAALAAPVAWCAAAQASGAPAPGKVAGFLVSRVAEGVWCISDNNEVNAYLVEGTESALLVDTTTGARNIARCVASLTKLPVEVVATHGHNDHIGGVGPFGRAYVHPADWKLAAASIHWRGPVRFTSVRAGHRFDLGGRVLEVIGVPGHTAGSIVLLDAAHRLLFAGDNDNTICWLFLRECLPLETYLESLRALDTRVGEFDTILPGHGAPLDAAFIKEQIACAEQIVSGACKGTRYRWFGGTALLCTFKRAGIAFDAGKLHAKP